MSHRLCVSPLLKAQGLSRFNSPGTRISLAVQFPMLPPHHSIAYDEPHSQQPVTLNTCHHSFHVGARRSPTASDPQENVPHRGEPHGARARRARAAAAAAGGARRGRLEQATRFELEKDTRLEDAQEEERSGREQSSRRWIACLRRPCSSYCDYVSVSVCIFTSFDPICIFIIFIYSYYTPIGFTAKTVAMLLS